MFCYLFAAVCVCVGFELNLRNIWHKNPSPNMDGIDQKISDMWRHPIKRTHAHTHTHSPKEEKKIDRWSIISREVFYVWSGLWQSFTVKLTYVLNGSFVTMRQISIIFVLTTTSTHTHTHIMFESCARWLGKICINTRTSSSSSEWTSVKKKEFTESEKENRVAKTKQWKIISTKLIWLK